MVQTKIRVLIVGGGFGGVKTALELEKDKHFEVTLLSDAKNLRFFPALYHTATGGAVAESSIPLTTIFEHKHVKLVSGSAQTLDRGKRSILTSDNKTYTYD